MIMNYIIIIIFYFVVVVVVSKIYEIVLSLQAWTTLHRFIYSPHVPAL